MIDCVSVQKETPPLQPPKRSISEATVLTGHEQSPAQSHATGPITLTDFQQLIHRMYFTKDQERGVEGTFMWLMEEVGELAASLREGSHSDCEGEFADVLAWLATIANVAGVDLAEAVRKKYGAGCPGCGQFACTCPNEEKP